MRRRYYRTRVGTFRRPRRLPPATTHVGYAIRFVAAVIAVPWMLYGALAVAGSFVPSASAAAADLTPGAVSVQDNPLGPTKVVMPEIIEITDEEIQKPGHPTQYQKDSAAIVCLERFDGEAATQCYRDLLAIAWVESRWNNGAIGDGGASHGPFQIYLTVHRNVTPQQAFNFRWSARWTLDRIIAHGYPSNREWALGVHNSMTPEINARYSGWVQKKSEVIKQQGI